MSETPTLFRRALAIARRLFTPVALLFLVVAAYSVRDTFGSILAQARLMPLLLAMLAWSLLHLLVPLIAAAWLRGSGVPVGYRPLLRMHLARLPARYLPGGIWHTVSRVLDLQAMGVPRQELAALVLMENLAPLAAALVLGGVMIIAATGGGAAVAAPVVAGLLIALLLPSLRRRLFPGAGRLPASAYVVGLGLASAFWMIAAAAFGIYWSAFPPTLPGIGTLELLGTYLLSWAAGFIAIFAPQGIGVFESVFGLLMKGALPFAGIAVLAAGFRVVVLAGDALAYLAWLLATRLAAPAKVGKH